MILHVYVSMLMFWMLFGTSVQTHTPEPSLTACPDGWSQFRSTCYLHVKEWVSWDEANTRCAEHDAILAEPDTRDKFRYLAHLIGGYYSWIGGTDRQTEGIWVWNSSGTHVDPSLWYRGQPNSRWGDEDCLYINPIGWNDYACSDTRVYLCEKQANVY